MNDTKIVMTSYGEKILRENLERLIKVERENIKKAIAEARSHGDLKENSEYHAAKEKQAHIEGKILEIQSKLNHSQVVDISKLSGSKIVFGATVTIYDNEKDKRMTYQIVGEDECQSSSGKISYNSPLGKSLIGLEKGDTAIVNAPKGNLEYDIEEVSYR